MSRTGLKILAASVVVAALLAGSAASAMTFRRIDAPAVCGPRACILAQGQIDADSAAAFSRFLDGQAAAGAVLILDSPGGDLGAAFALAREIRRRRMPTRVWRLNAGAVEAEGECASACAYAFVGGVDRQVGPGARVGVHQVNTPAGQAASLSLADVQWYMAMAGRHLSAMGAAPDLIIPALQTPPQQMWWLTRQELARYRVVTDASPVIQAGYAGGPVSPSNFPEWSAEPAAD